MVSARQSVKKVAIVEWVVYCFQDMASRNRSQSLFFHCLLTFLTWTVLVPEHTHFFLIWLCMTFTILSSSFFFGMHKTLLELLPLSLREIERKRGTREKKYIVFFVFIVPYGYWEQQLKKFLHTMFCCLTSFSCPLLCWIFLCMYVYRIKKIII